MDKGQSRVIIENVMPRVDGGLYPAKRTVGERVDVSAHIFADGHDHLRAFCFYKKEESTDWYPLELKESINDEWHGSFYVTEKGTYVFKVMAWVDHFLTWYDGISKKIKAGLDVSVELLEGAAFLKSIAKTEGESELLNIAKELSDKKEYSKAIELVTSDDFLSLVKRQPYIQHETVYHKELKVIVEFNKALFSSWYEFFPRSASLSREKHGTFKDCIRLLPRVKAMGFDVLYLPPIHPIGKVNRKGKNNSVNAAPGEPGSPWAIGSDEGGHKSIHAELGTHKDYQELITKAKEIEIDIALDLAFQCAPDHPYVKEHPEWFKHRPDGSIQYAENPPKKYQDIYPFNFECDDYMALWEELKSVITYWIDKGVKIFRVDNPHTKPFVFWQWCIAEVNKEYDDIIFLSEAFTRPKVMASLAKGGFTQSYTYFSWRNSKSEIMEYMNELVYGPSRDYFRPNFWPNTPDINPYYLQANGENGFILRVALAATLSSNYGLYGPVYEFYESEAVSGKEEYFNSEKYEIRKHDWNKVTRLTDIITLLNKARHENKALQSTWNITFCQINHPHLMAYVKATDDLSNIILVIVNMDVHNKHASFVELPKARLNIEGVPNVKLLDLITGDQYTWTQEWNYVELDPYRLPFHLFRLEVHESFK
jgi:starch synthase (maltosyl-transferring)